MKDPDSALDPTDLRPWRSNPCEREVTLLCSLIRQALMDAEAIGRSVRLTGETHYKDRGPEFEEKQRAEHLAELRAWMTADASDGIFSLEGVCDLLSASIRERVEADDIRRVIEFALAGRPPEGLTDFRTVNVAGGNPSASRMMRDHRSEYVERKRRRAEREQQQEAAA